MINGTATWCSHETMSFLHEKKILHSPTPLQCRIFTLIIKRFKAKCQAKNVRSRLPKRGFRDKWE